LLHSIYKRKKEKDKKNEEKRKSKKKNSGKVVNKQKDRANENPVFYSSVDGE
jgi:hypothetical protein